MGGSALKVSVRRLSAAEYHPLAHDLSRAIARASGARVESVPAYGNKPDFGDIDLLIEKEALDNFGRGNLKDWLRANLNTREIHESKPDSPSLSFDYRNTATEDIGVQVDLIMTNSATFDMALDYYSYNDLGGLVGVLARAIGFSYTPNGLIYNVTAGTRRIGVVPITTNTEAALKLLGLDPAVFKIGFFELESIFHYVATSPYFNPDLYLLEKRNHSARTRDRKRATYQSFLGWLRADPGRRGAGSWDSKTIDPAELTAKRASLLQNARACFPDFAVKLDTLLAEDVALANLRARFNANKVSIWTGMKGIALGRLMEVLRDTWPDAAAKTAWFEVRNDEEVAEWVRQKAGIQAQPRVRMWQP